MGNGFARLAFLDECELFNDETAEVVKFLVSDSASYITGQSIIGEWRNIMLGEPSELKLLREFGLLIGFT